MVPREAASPFRSPGSLLRATRSLLALGRIFPEARGTGFRLRLPTFDPDATVLTYCLVSHMKRLPRCHEARRFLHDHLFIMRGTACMLHRTQRSLLNLVSGSLAADLTTFHQFCPSRKVQGCPSTQPFSRCRTLTAYRERYPQNLSGSCSRAVQPPCLLDQSQQRTNVMQGNLKAFVPFCMSW